MPPARHIVPVGDIISIGKVNGLFQSLIAQSFSDGLHIAFNT